MANPGGIPGADFFDALPDFADWASNPTILLIIAAIAVYLGQECADAWLPVPIIPSDEDTAVIPCPEETAAGLVAGNFFAIDQRKLEFTAEEQAGLDAENPDLDLGFELEPTDPDAPQLGLSLWMDEFQIHLEELNDRHRLAYGQRRLERYNREQGSTANEGQRRQLDRLANRRRGTEGRSSRVDPFNLA